MNYDHFWNESLQLSVFSRFTTAELMSLMTNVANSPLLASYFPRLITTTWNQLFWLIMHLRLAFSLMVWSSSLASAPTMAKPWLCVCSIRCFGSDSSDEAILSVHRIISILPINWGDAPTHPRIPAHPHTHTHTLPYCAKEIHHHVVTGIP